MIWQPIDTAPKGDAKWGGPRLLLGNSAGVWFGRYDSDAWAKKPRPFWSGEGSTSRIGERANQPTHWQPEPDPPGNQP